jgi:hypothetical protein
MTRTEPLDRLEVLLGGHVAEDRSLTFTSPANALVTTNGNNAAPVVTTLTVVPPTAAIPRCLSGR